MLGMAGAVLVVGGAREAPSQALLPRASVAAGMAAAQAAAALAALARVPEVQSVEELEVG